jgi:transposase-like protein
MKRAFSNENSLMKLLYMGIQNAKEKWTKPVHNLSLIISQLAIFFQGRLDYYLEL